MMPFHVHSFVTGLEVFGLLLIGGWIFSTLVAAAGHPVENDGVVRNPVDRQFVRAFSGAGILVLGAMVLFFLAIILNVVGSMAIRVGFLQ